MTTHGTRTTVILLGEAQEWNLHEEGLSSRLEAFYPLLWLDDEVVTVNDDDSHDSSGKEKEDEPANRGCHQKQNPETHIITEAVVERLWLKEKYAQ